jgi:hypothetical protein
MNKYKIFNSLSILLVIFVFSSCISIERAIKINEDGSGSEVMTVHYDKDFFDFMKSTAMAFDSVNGKSMIDSLLNEDLFENEMKDKYKKIDGITFKEIKAKYNDDSSMTLILNYTFKNIERLAQTLQTVSQKDEMFGKGKFEISFKKESKKIHFRYMYEMGDQSDSNRSLKNSMAGFFKDQKMTFNITFPYKIVSSNAMKTSGKTLTWEFDMDKMISEGKAVDLVAEMKK